MKGNHKGHNQRQLAGGKSIIAIVIVVLASLAIWNHHNSFGSLLPSPQLQSTFPKNNIIFPETSETILRNPAPKLWTLGDMKTAMRLPCNFVHDGYYIRESNEVLYQVYTSLMEMIQHDDDDDDIIPVVVECGGHDGITKSISLKASMCLNVNTLLVEASPSNYHILNQTRAYDHTVHAALCDASNKDGYVVMEENPNNSGQNKIITGRGNNNASLTTTRSTNGRTAYKVPCTTLDDELDALVDSHGGGNNNRTELRQKVRLVFLVLDIEGYEIHAIQGLRRYSPQKAMMEVTKRDQSIFDSWAQHHSLLAGKNKCHGGNDVCFNFVPELPETKRQLFYGARSKDPPEHTWMTSKASKAYMYYGE